jgi:ribosomal-protein-alanine N-acetyltransferase
VSLRRASLRELPKLLAIDAACFAAPWTEQAWRIELDASDRSFVWVAGEPALALACATIVLDTCELRRIAVTPSARGRGLGRDLLFHVIAHARAANCDRVELEVAAHNFAALRRYREAGFQEVGRRPRYYRDPPDDALLMTLPLTSTNVGSAP